MSRCTLLLLLIFTGLFESGQQMPLTSFKDSLLPKSGAGDLFSVTQSPNRFEVSVVRDSLHVLLNNDSTPSHSVSFALKNGMLNASNTGEASGQLTFTSAAGDIDTIFKGPVQHIFSCYGRIFFTSGVWYMSTHYGQLYQLDTARGEFKARIFSSFDYPIRQCFVTRDSMYLVSYGILYRMQYGKAVVVATLPFTCTSMAAQGRFMYFGIHGGYARLDLKSKQYRYFVYIGK